MLLLLISIMGIGDYVYRTGTAVHWSAHLFHTEKTPLRFVTPGSRQGPFRGERWERWMDHDVSCWWLRNVRFEAVRILDPSRPVKIAGCGCSLPIQKGKRPLLW